VKEERDLPEGASTLLDAGFTRARKIAAAGRTRREITVARALGSPAEAGAKNPAPVSPPPLLSLSLSLSLSLPPHRWGGLSACLLLAAYPPPMDTSLTGSLTPVERPGFLSYVTITHT